MSSSVKTSYLGFVVKVTATYFIVHNRNGRPVAWVKSMSSARKVAADLRRAERA